MFYKTIEKDELKLSFTSYLRRRPELEVKLLEIKMALVKIVGEEDVVPLGITHLGYDSHANDLILWYQ